MAPLAPPALVRRIGVIGDVHGRDGLLETAILHLEDAGVDRILCVGDIADGCDGEGPPGSVNRCYELLEAHGVLTVRGNHERWLLGSVMRSLPDATILDELTPDALRFARRLPVTVELSTPLGGLLLCHGLGENDMASVGLDDSGLVLMTNDALQALIRDERYRFVVNGHTHASGVRNFSGLTVLNAGTLVGNKEPPGFVVADFERAEAAFFEFRGQPEIRARRSLVALTEP
jgi:predicted phosphodiesterase